MATVQKTNHRGLYQAKQKISEKSLLPGMIVEFAYNNKDVYDRRPLVFVMMAKKGLLHGVNLNYLKPFNVQRFFKYIWQKVAAMELENRLGLKESYQRVQIASRLQAKSFTAQRIYDLVFPMDPQLSEAYRTFSLHKASSMSVVNLDLEIMTKEGKPDITINLDETGIDP